MNSASYLALLRRRLVDVDPTAQRFEDADLWQATADTVLEFTVRGLTQYGTYSVSASDVAGGVTPDFTDADALITALKTAWILLSDLYRDQVNRGELGGSWQSGLESESTIDVRKGYSQALADLDLEVEQLTILRAGSVFATRPQ